MRRTQQLTQDQMREKLQRAVLEAGSQSALAKKLGIKNAYMSDILAGKRAISATVAKMIGYMRLEVFVPDIEE